MLMLILVFFECSLHLSTYIENSVQSHLKINTMGSCLFKPKACFINLYEKTIRVRSSICTQTVVRNIHLNMAMSSFTKKKQRMAAACQ